MRDEINLLCGAIITACAIILLFLMVAGAFNHDPIARDPWRWYVTIASCVFAAWVYRRLFPIELKS